ncbi:hypothetical protein OU995_11710 [Roseateles sp. SL47]|uniref:hypothetical protein n=1 Tax=Roseateles sp. SL47 TaxID=2995138 RepID=UPI002271E202|nr:hypothetical protein [Roseateles sp. SL47]WAC75314.1 hypothetical protein OU995_11710 [Roseateles sp. SL47]
MSRRARLRAKARPWEDLEDLRTLTPDLDEDDDSATLYLSTGDRIDTHSAWVMPGQQEQPR